MNKNLVDLHEQRGRLLERIAGQRLALGQQLAPLQRASDTGSRLFALLQAGVHYLRGHPLPVLAALSGLVLLKPRRAWRWLGHGLLVWRSWRTLRAWVPPSLWAALNPKWGAGARQDKAG